MYKVKNGALRTVVHNKEDLDLYLKAGWTLFEEDNKKEEKPKAQKKEKVDEQSRSRRKFIKK